MANKVKGFGLTAELSKKKAAKFDSELSTECFAWMAAVLDEAGIEHNLPSSIGKQEDIVTALKDGVILCKLMNLLKPGSIRKINTNKLAFKMMENIGNFLSGCEAIGCNKTDLFQTVDLYEGQNIPQVVNGIMAVGRKSHTLEGYTGPTLGPQESTENKRTFTDEQLRASEGIIGLQAGTNQGASQAGQNFGLGRQIADPNK